MKCLTEREIKPPIDPDKNSFCRIGACRQKRGK